jgi:hAT family C-terminal dimerisation region
MLLFVVSYLIQPSVVGNIDVLGWWKQNQTVYPNLSRMAGDFLSIPATSVPSERLFSDAGQLITNRRNCLNGDVIQACICLDS